MSALWSGTVVREATPTATKATQSANAGNTDRHVASRRKSRAASRAITMAEASSPDAIEPSAKTAQAAPIHQRNAPGFAKGSQAIAPNDRPIRKNCWEWKPLTTLRHESGRPKAPMRKSIRSGSHRRPSPRLPRRNNPAATSAGRAALTAHSRRWSHWPLATVSPRFNSFVSTTRCSLCGRTSSERKSLCPYHGTIAWRPSASHWSHSGRSEPNRSMTAHRAPSTKATRHTSRAARTGKAPGGWLSPALLDMQQSRD